MLGLVMQQIANQSGTYCNDVSFLRSLSQDEVMREWYAEEYAHEMYKNFLEFTMMLITNELPNRVDDDYYEKLEALKEGWKNRARNFTKGFENYEDPDADHPFLQAKIRIAPNVVAIPGVSGVGLGKDCVIVYMYKEGNPREKQVFDTIEEIAPGTKVKIEYTGNIVVAGQTKSSENLDEA